MEYKQLAKIYYKDKKSYEKTYQNRFNSDNTVKLSLNIGNNPAFVFYNKEIVDLVEKIHISARQISSFNMSDLATQQFTLLCLSNEVFSNNDIEGIYSTRKQINEILKLQKMNTRLAPLTLKYEKLLSGIEIPLNTPQDLRNLYDEILAADVYNENNDARLDGKIFRKDVVHITDGLNSVHDGIVGEKNIISTVRELFDIINSNKLNPLLNIALLHYFLGYIHPFYDGNGRMMRFLSSYQLSKLFSPFVALNLSNTINENKNNYYKMFKQANDEKNKGDLTPFVISFLELILDAISDLELFILKKQSQEKEAYEKMSSFAFGNKNEKAMVELLLTNAIFGTKNMSLEDMVSFSKLSNATVRNIIKRLLKYDWFICEKESKHYIYYIDLKKFN